MASSLLEIAQQRGRKIVGVKGQPADNKRDRYACNDLEFVPRPSTLRTLPYIILGAVFTLLLPDTPVAPERFRGNWGNFRHVLTTNPRVWLVHDGEILP